MIELSNLAYHRGIITCSDFLNLNELNILHTTPKDLLPVPYQTFGGYACSERQMAAFLPDAFCMYMDKEEDIYQYYPLQTVRIFSLHAKYAETLTHRDYLGALLNLGIERAKIGDIILMQQQAYVFASKKIAGYIIGELRKVRHTAVAAEIVDLEDFHYEPKYEEIKGTVASVRLDTLLSLVYRSSRNKLTLLIEGGCVFVNGKLITSNGYRVKKNDIISVRKMGRFRYNGILSETKKGKYFVSVYKYI